MKLPIVESRAALLLLTSHLVSIASAKDDDGLSDAPAVGDFLYRGWARATVIGNYLYIDGGEVSQKIQGTSQKLKTVDSTLSIDLSSSWRPENVQIRQIPKNAPKVQRQAIFTDESSSSFYTWGGFIGSKSIPSTAPAEVWRFQADGSGGGSWSLATTSNLNRSHGGPFVSMPGSGFYFGGVAENTQNHDEGSPLGAFLPGFLQVDYASAKQGQDALSNHTEAPDSEFKTLYSGSAHFCPTFGSNGLIMLLGGSDFNSGSRQPQDRSMEQLWFMDPATKKWYSQRTSGTAPARRRWLCSVGAQSRDNTYEIFVFGGKSTYDYDDVWILSIPGFFWKQANYKPERPRSLMSCVLAGQRQMITIGGANHTSRYWALEPDPFPQGIGIFDLTELVWKDTFDAQAAEYDSPDIIKSWYYEGNLGGVRYDSGVSDFLNNVRRGSEDLLKPDVSNDDILENKGGNGSLSPAATGGVVGGSILGSFVVAMTVFFLAGYLNCKPIMVIRRVMDKTDQQQSYRVTIQKSN